MKKLRTMGTIQQSREPRMHIRLTKRNTNEKDQGEQGSDTEDQFGVLGKRKPRAFN